MNNHIKDYDISYIQQMFANTPNEDIELDNIFDTHYISIDKSDVGYGREVFSLSTKLARYLLHNLSHEVPTENDIKRIIRLKDNLEVNGMKNSWPKKPISINKDSLTIEGGIKRLYAIALLTGERTGVMMPMELVETEEEEL